MLKSIEISRLFKTILCAALLAAALPGSGHAQASPETRTTLAIGTARVYKDNVAGARDQAIRNGLISAVDRIVMDMLPVESLVENFQTANEILQGNTRAFIQGYQVLAEQRVDKTYRVLVQATLATTALGERFSNAGIVLGKKTLPTVLFFIAERNIDDETPRYWWGEDLQFFKPIAEYAMSEALRKKGYIIMDPGAVIQSGTVEIDTQNPDLGNTEAVNLGTHLGADVVILGQSEVEATANVMGANIRSFEATVRLRAILAKTGAEIGSTTQTAVAAKQSEYEGSTEALTQAGALAGEALSKQIASAWEKGSEGPSMVKIIVEGTQNLVNFVLFRKTLNDISGIEGIKTREMRPDTSTIMIEYTGTPKQLADALMLKTVENFGINITEVSDDHLRVEIVSK
jgi:hypothetical protein